MKQKSKILNLRLFFIGMLGAISGILCFYNLFKLIWLNKFSFWLVLFSTLFVVCIGLIITFSLAKCMRRFLKYVIVFAILFLIVGGIFSLKIVDCKDYKDYGENCDISGVVSSHYHKDNYYFVTLKNVSINGDRVDSKLNLYITLTSPMSESLTLGDRIAVVADISFKPLVTDKINMGHYVNSTVYSSSVVADDLTIINEKPNILEFLHERLRMVLNKGLTNENADIAYGVLVGDKTELDMEVVDTFSYAGISHILAVSGLHVGFLVMLITFFLNLIKVGRKKRFFITSAILVLYSIFCGLTPSILRASFMSIILLLAGVLGEEYDGLNSLGLAGVLILLLFPLDLFSIGFQLSFMCVFMIITLADKLTKILTGWRIPELIASAVSISLCVTIGSSIIAANVFNEVSLISIVANLIVIPLFSITYPLLFVLALISLIIPAFSGILFIPQILLHVIKLIANFFAGINFAQFRVFNLGYWLLFVFVLLSYFVKFLMLSTTIKSIICSCLAVMCIGLFVGGVQPHKFKTYALYTYYQYNTNSALITTEHNKKYLIGYDDYSSVNYLTQLKINYLDAVIIQDFEVNKIDDYIQFFKTIKVDKLIIPTNGLYSDIVFKDLNKHVEVKYVDNYIDEIEVDFIKNDNIVCGTIVRVNHNTILFPNGITKIKLEGLSYKIDHVDYIVVNNSKYDFRDYNIDYEYIVYNKSLNFETNKAISLKNKSNYVIQLG